MRKKLGRPPKGAAVRSTHVACDIDIQLANELREYCAKTGTLLNWQVAQAIRERLAKLKSDEKF
jgi:hypothetical protein